MRKIILASSSPRRTQLLKQIGLAHTIVKSDVDEKISEHISPRKQAENLSLQKAKAVAKNYPDALIIAADTIIVLGKKIIGKPKSKKDAKRILRLLSGKPHKVFTGFTLIDTANKKTITDSEESTVYVKKLTEKEINAYVASKEPLDKAGAYGINEKGAVIIEKIEGDFSNVVGLPLYKLSQTLEKFGINVL